MKLTCPMAYSRKNLNRWGGVDTLFWKLDFLARFVTLPWEILEKTSFYPWKSEILRNCVPPLGNSKVKNQDPRKFHIGFSLKPQKFHFFLIGPWDFYMPFLWNGNFMSSTLGPNIWIHSGISNCWKCLVWNCNKKCRFDQWAWTIRD